MAVGLGASTALFALVDAILLRPLPYPDPETLVRVFDTNERTGIDRSGITTGNLFEWRARTKAFSGIAGYYVWAVRSARAATPRQSSPRR